jgi:hypothetical protein
MQIAPMNPWLHMYYATTGLSARQVLINGGQQIRRQEVLKLYTANNNGLFLREEEQTGEACGPGRLERRLLHSAGREREGDPVSTHGGGRHNRSRCGSSLAERDDMRRR